MKLAGISLPAFAPSITDLSPSSGPIGTSISVAGTNFGATQGSSTVTFNGTLATPTSWSATSIEVPVPSGATTGPVVVTVDGQNSNGVTFTVSQSQGPGVRYIYDGLGRLVAVVDPATYTAIYHYDSVGNLSSISRQSSSLVAVIAFSPPSGAIGTSVTIYGTGFSTIPSQNVVTFNGVAGNVTSASATQITATVQSGTSTGPITVTTPTGSATSSTSFVVSAGNSPTISGFNPTIGTPNTPVTITGTNFDPDPYNDKTRFNITYSPNTAVTTTSITTTVPLGASSGRISVATPNGTAVSSADFFIPPSSHSPSQVGVTGRMSIGDILNITIGPNLVGIMVFDGTAGQRVSVGMTNVTIAQGVCCPSSVASVAIYQPDNTLLLGPFGFGQGGHGTPSKVLPVTGTYVILVDPFNSWSGGVTLTLSEDLSPPIAIDGTSVALGFNRPGQNGYVSFAGSAGQRVSLGMSNVTIAQGICCPNTLAEVVVYNPDGTTLLPAFGFWGSGGGTPSLVLPMDGVYSIEVNPLYNWTGNITLTVSEDLSPPISIGGPSVPLDLNRPGQNGYLTFSGTAGQRVSLGMSDVTIAQGICCPNGLGDVVVYKPDGTTLLSAFGFWGSGGGTPSFVLPVSGNYSVVVNPFYHWTGNVTVTVSEDLSPPIAIGGPSVPMNFRAGQNGYLSFTGTAGQRVSLGMTDVTIAQGICCPNQVASVVIYKPDSTTLLSPYGFGAGGGGSPSVVLPVNGTYSIVVNPEYHWSGNITVTLSEDLSPPIQIGGPPVPLDHRPGQNSYVTFSGTAGQRVSVGMSNVTVAQGVCCPSSVANIVVYKPDGTIMLSTFGFGAGGGGTASFVLPVSGNYSIQVNPLFGWMGNVTLTVSEDLSPPIAINDPAVVLNFDRVGQNAYMTFSGSASQQVTVRITGNTTGNMTVTLLNSGGSTLTSKSSGGAAFNLSTITLPTTGIYAIRVDPSGTNTGAANVAVTSP